MINYIDAHKNSWRSDIEGLRFFAILPIVIFHLNPDLLPNGYLGVDLFFIISGYLTSKQYSEHNYQYFYGTFEFIKKRFVRIFPALSFWTCLFSVIFAFYLLPIQHKSYFNTAIYSYISVSNIYIYLQGLDYFSPNQNLNPFLHLWSISVEDQFYLLFSALFLIINLIYSDFKSSIFFILLLSFIPIIQVKGSFVMEAYFLPQFRFWEFMIGAYSFCFFKNSFNINHFLYHWLKLCSFAIFIIFILFPFHISFYYIPVFCLISVFLLFDTHAGDFIARFFALPIFRFIGQISYSIYLIHFPLLVLISYYFDTARNHYVQIFYIISLVFIGSLSYIHIESRREYYLNLTKSKSLFYLFLVIFISLSASSIPSILPSSRKYELLLSRSDKIKNSQFSQRSVNNKILVLGDSHAQMFNNLFSLISTIENFEFIDKTGSGCIFGYNIDYIKNNDKKIDVCKQDMNESIDSLSTSSLRAVIIANRLSAYFSPYLISVDDRPVQSVTIDKKLYPVFGYAALSAYLKHIDEIFAAHPNQKFIILDPIPEMIVPTFKCIFNNAKQECQNNKESEIIFLSRVHSGLVEIANKRSNVRILTLFNYICDNTSCPNIKNGEFVYRDDDHLSNNFVVKHSTLLVNLINH